MQRNLSPGAAYMGYGDWEEYVLLCANDEDEANDLDWKSLNEVDTVHIVCTCRTALQWKRVTDSRFRERSDRAIQRFRRQLASKRKGTGKIISSRGHGENRRIHTRCTTIWI